MIGQMDQTLPSLLALYAADADAPARLPGLPGGIAVQLLGTLNGMEPVVKQIRRHHGSPGFPGVAWKSRTWRGEGRQRRPRPHPPALKCSLIRPNSGYR